AYETAILFCFFLFFIHPPLMQCARSSRCAVLPFWPPFLFTTKRHYCSIQSAAVTPPSSLTPNYPSSYFHFELLHQSNRSAARVGRIHTPHGRIDTPGFVPVGTNGTLKYLSTFQARDCQVQAIFCNTYHLMI